MSIPFKNFKGAPDHGRFSTFTVNYLNSLDELLPIPCKLFMGMVLPDPGPGPANFLAAARKTPDTGDNA